MVEHGVQPALQEHWTDACWVQLNVALVRQDDDALPSARALFDEVKSLISEWRAEDRLQWFFFMRKPPDVRLRFRVRADRELKTRLSAVMANLYRQNQIREYFYSSYYPESDRFGGCDCMRSVHAYFDADTAAWMHLDILDQSGQRKLTPDELLPAIVQDLFLSAGVHNPDVMPSSWKRLRSLIGTPTAKPLPRVSSNGLNGLSEFHTLQGLEHECLEYYAQANETLTNDLRLLDADGKLERDQSDVLANVALFSFHRHGFAGERSGPIVAAAIDALQIEFRDQ